MFIRIVHPKRSSQRKTTVKLFDSQFGELLQTGEIVHMSDVVVLHKQMSEVGGKAKVGNVCYLIIIQVKDGEVSTLGEIPLKTEIKGEA